MIPNQKKKQENIGKYFRLQNNFIKVIISTKMRKIYQKKESIRNESYDASETPGNVLKKPRVKFFFFFSFYSRFYMVIFADVFCA